MEPISQTKVLTPSMDLAPPSSCEKVLTNTDILTNILTLTDSPATVVRAAAVSLFWRQIVSDSSFLRRFCDLHQLLPLGFYLTSDEFPTASFKKMPDLLEELAADVPHSSFNLKPDCHGMLSILDCCNGYVITGACAGFPNSTYVIRNLLHPDGGPPVTLPLPPQPSRHRYEGDVLDQAILLPENRGHGQSCTAVTLLCDMRRLWVHVREFRAPAWRHGCRSNKINIPGQFDGLFKKLYLLTHGMVYIVGMREQILALDLASMYLFHIQLPEGVEFHAREMNLRLSHAGSSGFYLVHVSGFELHIWLYSTNVGGVDSWMLVDTIDLSEAFGQLSNSVWLSGGAVCNVLAVGDNASFVFMQVMRELFYLHVSSRQVKKVFELQSRIRDLYVSDRPVVQLDPVTMIWPPTFKLRTGGDDEA